MGTPTPTGYAAEVKLWMSCAGRILQLSHVSTTSVIAREPIDLDPCDADVVVSVDGRESSRPVRLVHGMRRDTPKTQICPRESALAV
jgi:hypothetical protein